MTHRALTPASRSDRHRQGFHCSTAAFVLLGAFVVAAPAPGQITVTAPSVVDNVAGAADYATQVLQDPWDMQQLSDLGWFLYGVDSPASGLSNIAFNSGIFSATTSNGDPLIFLLDTPIPGTAGLGKTGTNFPIDAGKYTRLAFRMSLTSASAAQVFWSRNHMFTGDGGDVSGAGNISVYSGWGIYVQSIPALSLFLGTYDWSWQVRMLRLDPTIVSGDTLQLDWVRLVNYDASQNRTITWSGASSVDVYLDNDANAGNGNLGAIAKAVSGTSFSFYVGALPAGDYRVAVVVAGGNPTTASYSSGLYRVDGAPTLAFTSPSEEGSSDDFATTNLGDPWDMNALSDIDYTYGLSSLFTTSVVAQNEAGTSLGTIGVIQGVSSAVGGSVGEASVWPFHWTDRGASLRIDPERYRILTLEMGMPIARDLVHGSVARIIWKVAGEAVENVSQDVVVNSKAGSPVVIDKIICDMKALPLETDPGGSPSTTGWNRGSSASPGIDGFRVDPHEFPSPTDFYLKRVKLAALEQVGSSYQIAWTFSPSGSSTTLSLYYDQTGQGFSGTLIASGVNPTNVDATHGNYSWNTNALPAGSYYVYAKVMLGGSVVNQTYARWPIVKVGTGGVTISLNRSALYYGATSGGAIKTSGQEVVVTVAGGSAGWSVGTSGGFLQVSPSSGVGSGKFTVSIASGSYAVGTYNGLVTVTAPGAVNSPQTVAVTLKVYGSGATAVPFGYIDSPSDGVVGVVGAVPFTGWALDDIEVQKVELWRDPFGGEPATHPNGLVYIGVATLVAGQRPDVEAVYPTYPMAYRAAWGYSLLTNLLPGGGNGTFRLHAYVFDVDGHQRYLGSRSFTASNAVATRPFGTIDTPAQGATVSGGSYVSWGWALTPLPNTIPADGSSIWVYIDGVAVGHPSVGYPRSDIDTLFPGLNNTGAAVRYYVIDTTALANGVHTIVWGVVDNNGNAEGIGSRYFWVLN